MSTLSRKEFEVLRALDLDPQLSQRDIAERSGLSLGSVNGARKSLVEHGFIQEDDGAVEVTETGRLALEPYRVDNAIIMAAGLSSRFAPISYEKPKGLLKVHGEVLIERQIRQLKERGIDEIYVVVGYKKEYFFYLEDELGVKLLINDEYASRNNNSSLKVAAPYLANSYICSSDVYYTENPFQPFEYQAYYAATFVEGDTAEWCIKTGAGNRIIGVQIGGADSWIMLGHAYFDVAFSEEFRRILLDVYDHPETADKLWEEIYIDHIKDLNMVLKPYKEGQIFEFDSLDELRLFDPSFLENLDSEVFDHIEDVLQCGRHDISDIYPLKQGLTNLSCHFRVGDKEYVYRHPGVGTELLIDRKAEAAAQRLAKSLGMDDTFIYEDEERGWKISYFLPDCTTHNPHDDQQLREVMEMCRNLHEQPIELERHFDFFKEGKGYEQSLREYGAIDVPDFEELAAKVERLHTYISADGFPQCLNHNDYFELNILRDQEGKSYLIDWEYAGMSDCANDYGTYVTCCQLSDEEAERALSYYHGRVPTAQERRHFLGLVGLAGWCWYVWSLLKEAEGDFVGEWLYIYYRYGKKYTEKALRLYEEAEA